MKKTLFALATLSLFSGAALAAGLEYIDQSDITETKQNQEIGSLHLRNSHMQNSNFDSSSITEGFIWSPRDVTTPKIVKGIMVENTYTNPLSLDTASVVSNSSFKGLKVDLTNNPEGTYGATFLHVGRVGNEIGYGQLYNVDFSNADVKIKHSGEAAGIIAYWAILDKVSFSGAKFDISGNSSDQMAFWFSSAKASHLNFKNMTITCDAKDFVAFGISGNPNTWTTLSDVDLRGTTVNGKLFERSHFALSNLGSHADIRNVILGNNTIYSCGDITWEKSQTESLTAANKGLILENANDSLTIDGGEAILDVSSNVSQGQLIFENGGKLNLADNTSLTIDGAIDLIVSGASVDLSDILSFGENSTIVLSGYGSQEAALNAFKGMIKYDDNGVLKTADVSDINNLGNNVSAVPEPATVAAILGALALGFAVYRKRK